MPHALADRGRFPPLQRVQIEQLACCAPGGIGLEMTHWSTRSLAQVAVARERGEDCPFDRLFDFVFGLLATASLQVLEDANLKRGIPGASSAHFVAL
jgi:hypothetical protein